MKFRATLLAVALCSALILPAAAMVLSASSQSGDSSAPIAEDLTLNTYKDIAISSRFSATDPDGDPLSFRVVDPPARGQVTVDRTDPAAFWYTPYAGKKGKDSFTYVAVDPDGNQSEPATVNIVIEKQRTKVTYSDMSGEPAAYAATRLAEAGIYVGCQVDGLYCFYPAEGISREEFLSLAMTVAESEPLEGVTLTGFSDDDSISVWAKGYVSAALMQGAVRGSYDESGLAVFRGSDRITCAEAAVMADRLLAVSDVAAVMSDAVPAWAVQAAANLESVSVLSPGAAMEKTLTWGEAAIMLSAMMDVVDGRLR